jgi:hypothetical protein
MSESGSDQENRDVEIAEMRDTLQTMMTTIQDLKQRLDALSPHSAPNRPAPAPFAAPAAAPHPSAGQSQAQLAQPQPAASQTSPSSGSSDKAWLAKSIVSGKYDYHQTPQQALITLKSFLDDLNAASPVIEALRDLDLTNVEQVANWAQTNRQTLYTISENFAARADDANKSLARLAGYIDYLKDKAFGGGGGKGQGQGQGRQGYSSSSSSSYSRPSRYGANG